MGEPFSSTVFQLPRVHRGTKRVADSGPAWSQHLAFATLAALVALALMGPWMTANSSGAQNALRQAGYVLIFVLALVATRPWTHPERLLVMPAPILASLVWLWLSAIWMIDLSVGMRRLILTTIVAWSLFALVRQLGVKKSLMVVRLILALMLAVNFAFVLFYPEIGRHPSQGGGILNAWRGIMAQKNAVGVPCAMTILFFIFDASCVHRALRILVIAGATVFLIMSESKTSIGVCAVSVAVGVSFGLLAKHRGGQLAKPGFAWLLLIIPALIFSTMAYAPSFYLDLVSDPTGFTGRTQIWSALIKAYADRPWLGVGFGSFWDIGTSSPIYQYASGWVTEMSEGHNSYLDLLVQVGFIGTMIVLFAVLVWPIQRLLYGGDHPARSLSAAILVFGAGHGFTESQIFDRDSLVQVFMMFAIGILWMVTASPVAGKVKRTTGRSAKEIRPKASLRL